MSHAQEYRALIASDRAHRSMSVRAARSASFTTLERYWNDPEYRDQIEAERAAGQQKIDQSIDEDQLARGVRWPANWTEKEKYEATMHLRGGDQ